MSSLKTIGREKEASLPLAQFAGKACRFRVVSTFFTAFLVSVINVQATFADIPAWRAALAEGECRLKTRELLPAEICFREAVRDVRRDKTSSADQVALCLESLAGVLQMQEKTEEAVPLYKKSLHILKRAQGKKSEATVPTLMVLGDIFRGDAQYRVAAKYYRQARVIVETKSGQSTLTFADLQHRLALTTYKAGYPMLAEKMYSSSLDVIMNQPQLPNNSLLDDVLNDYIHLLRTTSGGGRPLSSEVQTELLKDHIESLARTRNVEESTWNKEVSLRLIGPESAIKSDDQKNPAQPEPPVSIPSIGVDKRLTDSAALEQINKQRVDFYERMIAIDAKTLGEEHPSMARDLTGLAYVLLLQKKYDEAKLLINRALKIYRSAYGSQPLVVKRTEFLLTLIESSKEHSDLAVQPIKDYLATLPAIPMEAQKLEIALRLNYLGLLCYSEGKIEAAEKIYAWALSATAESSGEQSTLSGACLNDYARVLRNAGRTAEAERYESAASDILTRALIKQSAALIP